MNNFHLQLLWTLLVVLVLGGLVKLAIDGVIIAVAILAILGALVLVGFGVVITLVAGNAAAKREQTSFLANARENLSIMHAMQRIMNAQNSQLLKQAQQVGQLPPPRNEVVNLVEVDDSIFDVLED